MELLVSLVIFMAKAIIAIDIMKGLIGIGKDLTSIIKDAFSKDKQAVKDLYELYQMLLKSNQFLLQWVYRFQFFDFNKQNAKDDFHSLLREYSDMKNSPDFQKMKISCYDIKRLYGKKIDGTFLKWFKKKERKEEVAKIFEFLMNADNEMIEFIYETVIKDLEDFISKADCLLIKEETEEANIARNSYRIETKDQINQIQEIIDEFTVLINELANMYKQPLTIS